MIQVSVLCTTQRPLVKRNLSRTPSKAESSCEATAVRINLMIEGQEGVTWEQWHALACAAEGVGLEGLFRSDHYRSILRGEPAGALDAWATLAALAA